MEDEEIRQYIAAVKWRFAKTMANIPHEYTRRRDAPIQDKNYWRFVRHVQQHGIPERFFTKTFKYFYFDGYKYWTMEEEKWDAILINRAKA